MNSCVLTFALLSLIPQPWQPAPAPPPSSPPSTTTPLIERLEEIDRRGAEIRDLVADFEQRKHTPLLKKPLVSTGRVLVKGARVRWETLEPHATTMTIDEREVKIYYPDQKSLEIYPVEGGLARLSASPLPRLDAIREQFEIEAVSVADLDSEADPRESLALRLTPLQDSLKEHLSEVRVLLHIPSACMTRLEMIDADGERTTIVFRNVRTDTGIEAKALELTVPRATSVSRPLDGTGPSPSSDEDDR